MKLTFTRVLPVLVIAVLFYGACKKAGTKPTATTNAVDYKALSVKIALNLYQSITNQNGININKGLKLSDNAASYSGSVVPSNYNPCGFTVSPHNILHSTPGDSVIREAVFWTMISTCSSGVAIVDGYTVHTLDTLNINTPKTVYTRTTDQSDTVQALDATYKKFSMNGILKAITVSNRFDGPTYYVFGHPTNADGVLARQNYILKGLVIVNTNSPAGADVASGLALFHDSYTTVNINNPYGTNSGDDGVIEFLGNFTVRITFANGGGTFVIHLRDYTGVPG